MSIMEWKRIIEAYTPLVRSAAKKPTAKVIEMEQRKYGMAAEDTSEED